MSEVAEVLGREILDSRGKPTVEAEVRLQSGSVGRAAVPSGASTGRHEAVELRDGDRRRFLGQGVLGAVRNVETELRLSVVGREASDQEAIDRALIEADGTPDKGRLGANALLAVSLAVARAAAGERGESLYRYLGGEEARILPVPMMNILNGGAHASNSVDIQEFMVVPHGAETFAEGLRMGTEIFHALAQVLRSAGKGTTVGDEGGFAPDLDSDLEAAEMVMRAIERAGYRPGEDAMLAVDAAATELHEGGAYAFHGTGAILSTDEMIAHWEEMAARFPLASLEDPLEEDDWAGWAELTRRIGGRCQLVGDDLFATNPRRLERGIAERSANAILVKVNQIGTLTEATEAISAAEGAGWGRVVSHRSGETEDTFIADLAVATGAGQIKTGAPSRSDRVAKYNQLLRIQHQLGERALYGGRAARR